MIKKFLAVFAICSISLFTACGSKDNSKKNIDSSNFTAYEDSGYSISLPDDWGKTENKNTSLSFLYKNSKNDFFTESLNVIIQDIDTYDYTLDTYKDVSLSNYEELGYEIEECKKTTINDNEYYKIISYSENDGKNIYCKQIFTLRNKKAYIFTFAAEEKDFKNLSDEADAIFNTITFNDSTKEDNTSQNSISSDESVNTDESSLNEDTSASETSSGIDTPVE